MDSIAETDLVRLAGAFDLTLGGLIARAEGDTERLMRCADQSSGCTRASS